MSDHPASDDHCRARITRRDVLTTAVGGVAAALAGCARRDQKGFEAWPPTEEAPPKPQPRPRGPLPRPGTRTLGRTALEVTAFSMGAIGAQTAVLEAGLDAGINFIHCAQGYGTLDAVGAAIAGKRDDLLLGLKYERVGQQDWDYLDRALQALRVDHVDILFFPLVTPDAARDRRHLEFFNQVQKQNKARFIGITTHSAVAPTTQAAVEAGFWDVLMPSYVPAQEARAALQPVLDQAEKKNLGIVAMKTMAGIQAGAIDLMQAALQQVLADSSVTTLVKGVLAFEHLEALLHAATEPDEARGNDLQTHLARQENVCLLCGACPECPRGVNVFEVMRDFDYYYAQVGRPDIARAMYRQIPAAHRGSACDACGACASKCPNGVDIARHVQAADLVLG